MPFALLRERERMEGGWGGGLCVRVEMAQRERECVCESVEYTYGVATISRLLEVIGLVCIKSSFL